jgi:choline dehydrogenase-like flavoprotein
MTAASASSSLLTGCDFSGQDPMPWDRFALTVHRPGIDAGHQLRDAHQGIAMGGLPIASEQLLDVIIVGSGAAGLTAAWHLHKAKFKNFALLSGPEEHGNAAGLMLENLPCPTGAHYLPMPSLESMAVRQILSAMGVMQGSTTSERPSFDESVIVHSPSERILFNGQWQYGLSPKATSAQAQKFFHDVAVIATKKGNDGLKIFTVPIAFSSHDAAWRKLDTLTFGAWLAAQGFTDEHLLSYLDYCCRDEYGIGVETVSAWAGLHYFCSRSGHASNAEDGAVLTWPDGLSSVLRFLEKGIKHTPLWLNASAINLQRSKGHVTVRALTPDGKLRVITAKRVIMAAPLYVGARIDSELAGAYQNISTLLPLYQPWMVANLLFKFALPEISGAELSWDNVVHQSTSLGYINARHQEFRVSSTATTPQLLTAYHAMTGADPAQSRRWMAQASDRELLRLASTDMVKVYGADFWSHLQNAHITLRGHGMPGPRPGYLSNKLLTELGAETGQVLYANADLSGYSVFEEAAFWGQRAAELVLG